jgi:hypothetical protein
MQYFTTIHTQLSTNILSIRDVSAMNQILVKIEKIPMLLHDTGFGP